MIEEGDPIWNLMVSYFMQKDTDDDGTTRDDRGGIGDTRNLARSALLLAQWSNWRRRRWPFGTLKVLVKNV